MGLKKEARYSLLIERCILLLLHLLQAQTFSLARVNDVRQWQCGLFQAAPSNLTPAGDLWHELPALQVLPVILFFNLVPEVSF